jgi:hypothetical protein
VLLPLGLSGQGMKLTMDLHPVFSLRIHGVTCQILHYAFMACLQTALLFFNYTKLMHFIFSWSWKCPFSYNLHVHHPQNKILPLVSTTNQFNILLFLNLLYEKLVLLAQCCIYFLVLAFSSMFNQSQTLISVTILGYKCKLWSYFST